MKRLTVTDLVWLNIVAGQFGGSPGVRGDAGALEAVVARPYSGYGETELFPTPFDKAAAVMGSVIRRHPFVDGNKRTGLLAGAALLYFAGYDFAAPRGEMVEMPVAVAERRIEVEGLARWFEKHSNPKPKYPGERGQDKVHSELH